MELSRQAEERIGDKQNEWHGSIKGIVEVAGTCMSGSGFGLGWAGLGHLASCWVW